MGGEFMGGVAELVFLDLLAAGFVVVEGVMDLLKAARSSPSSSRAYPDLRF